MACGGTVYATECAVPPSRSPPGRERPGAAWPTGTSQAGRGVTCVSGRNGVRRANASAAAAGRKARRTPAVVEGRAGSVRRSEPGWRGRQGRPGQRASTAPHGIARAMGRASRGTEGGAGTRPADLAVFAGQVRAVLVLAAMRAVRGLWGHHHLQVGRGFSNRRDRSGRTFFFFFFFFLAVVRCTPGTGCPVRAARSGRKSFGVVAMGRWAWVGRARRRAGRRWCASSATAAPRSRQDVADLLLRHPGHLASQQVPGCGGHW